MASGIKIHLLFPLPLVRAIILFASSLTPAEAKNGSAMMLLAFCSPEIQSLNVAQIPCFESGATPPRFSTAYNGKRTLD